MGSEKDLGDAHPIENVVREPAEDPMADTAKTHNNVIHGARAAAEKERNMTLLQGLRLYPKAVAWSVLISTCIVMEGYDITLVNNFCKKY